MSNLAFYELQVNENYETGNFLAVVNAVVRGCDATACELCARLRSDEVDATIASACPSAAGPYLNLAARILGFSRPGEKGGRRRRQSHGRAILAGAGARGGESLSSARSDRSRRPRRSGQDLGCASYNASLRGANEGRANCSWLLID
jgi:hypothetical protein